MSTCPSLDSLARRASTLPAAIQVVQECVRTSGIVHADVKFTLIRKFHVHIALYLLNAWTTHHRPPAGIVPTIEDAFNVLNTLPRASIDDIVAASALIHAAVCADITHINLPNPSITKYFILAHSPLDHVAKFMLMEPWSRNTVHSFMLTLYNTVNPRHAFRVLFAIADPNSIYLIIATVMRTSDPLEAPLIPQFIAKAVLTKHVPHTHKVITQHVQQQLASEFAEINDPFPVDRAIYLAWAAPRRQVEQFGVLATEHPASARLFIVVVYETLEHTPPDIACLVPPQSHHHI